MSFFFNYNGNLHPEGTAIISSGNRGFKYGDGLFETMLVSNGKILLKEFHFERLFNGMNILHFDTTLLNVDALENEIHFLCNKNSLTGSMRIRLMIFRGHGELSSSSLSFPNYVIEAVALTREDDSSSCLVNLGIYHAIRKSCDLLCNLKINNFLGYTMGAFYAKKHGLDDVLMLNEYGRICDSTKANVFIVKDRCLFTPPLSEGCVAGVMRRWLLEIIPQTGYSVKEVPITIEDLENADGIMLTNAIKRINWVNNCDKKEYWQTLISDFKQQIMKLTDLNGSRL